MSNSRKIVLVLLLAVFAIAIFYFFYIYQGDHSAEVIKLRNQAINIIDRSRNPAYSEAVAKIEKALSLAKPNSAEEGALKINLARTKINVDQGIGSQADIYKLLKEVALNGKYPPSIQPRAFFHIGDIFMDYYNEDLARDAIFTGPVFKDFLIKDNVLLGMARIFERASDGGQGLASLRAVDLYADQLLMNAHLTSAQKTEFSTKIATLVEMGEQYLAKVENRQLKPSQLEDYTRKLGYLHRFRANIKEKLLLLSPSSVKSDQDAVTNIYKDALAILAKDDREINKKVEMYTRLDYAQWLYEAYGFSSSADIKSVLAPLYEESNKGPMEATVGGLFQTEKDLVHSGHYHYRGILELAKVDSKLKELLITRYEWSDNALNAPLPPLLKYGP